MWNNIKKALSSKTIWFAILLSALSVWQGLLGQLALTAVEQGIIGSLISACIIVLRFITTQPVSEK